MLFLKFLTLLTLSLSALAEYRFEGHHSYKVDRNEEGKIVLTLCYDQFTRCTGSVEIGDFKNLSLFIQGNIWRRKDVNLENYGKILAESKVILKGHQDEVTKREKTIKELSKNDPKVAESLRNYLTEAQIKRRDSEWAVNNLLEGKNKVDEVLKEVDRTLSGFEVKTFQEDYSYNFEDFSFRKCRDRAECHEIGIQFYISDKKNDFKNLLVKKAILKENKKKNYPVLTKTGLSINLLSTDVIKFGTKSTNQNAEGIKTEMWGDCTALEKSGTLYDTAVNCSVFGKNWRYPTLSELQNNRIELMSKLPKMDLEKFLITSNINPYSNPGNVALTICHPVYYNISKGKTLNNHPDIVKPFIFGKDPKYGANAICVCSKNCTI